jgi:outer membrane immunogenic protein
MFKSVASFAFVSCLAVSAFVAASPTKAQDYGPHRWTGVYIGAHGGWASSTVDYANTGTPEQDLSGAILGVQLGAQYHVSGGVVAGIEADVSFAKLNDTVRDGNYITESGQISSIGTVRGRLGYAMGAFLPYVTAGLAWDRLKQGEVCPAPAAAPFGFCNTHGPFDLSETKTNTGFVWGGGLEYAINQKWSIKAEGLWTDLGSTNYTLCCDAGAKPLPASIADHDIKMFRIGANLHF